MLKNIRFIERSFSKRTLELDRLIAQFPTALIANQMPVDIVVPSEGILGAVSNDEKFVITSQLLADDFRSVNPISVLYRRLLNV
jgi:hypothetical protein